jgi:hypothetical protein
VRPPTHARVPKTSALVLLMILLIFAVAAGARPERSAAQSANADGDISEVIVSPSAPDPEFESEVTVMTSAEAALGALGKHVRRVSDPEALRATFKAYYRYRAANAGLVRKPYLYYIDLGLDNRTARGYVFDMESLTMVDGPFTVAHGRGSARERNGVPARFSNQRGSKASSLGLYLAEATYAFRGRAGGAAYKSIGLRMRGESGSFNSAALDRGIVAHGAPYVTAREAGRSEGCPAMELHRAKRLLPLLANGGVVFIFSPNEPRWLREDPWLRSH